MKKLSNRSEIGVNESLGIGLYLWRVPTTAHNDVVKNQFETSVQLDVRLRLWETDTRFETDQSAYTLVPSEGKGNRSCELIQELELPPRHEVHEINQPVARYGVARAKHGNTKIFWTDIIDARVFAKKGRSICREALTRVWTDTSHETGIYECDVSLYPSITQQLHPLNKTQK